MDLPSLLLPVLQKTDPYLDIFEAEVYSFPVTDICGIPIPQPAHVPAGLISFAFAALASRRLNPPP